MFALIAGAATGAVLGILFAPDKGEETREKIKKAASEGYDSLKDITEEKAHELHVRARYARKEMNALKKTLAEQGAAFKEDAKEKKKEEEFNNSHPETGKCPKCGGSMRQYGPITFKLGEETFLFSDLNRLMSGSMAVRLERCKECGYTEFYTPNENELL